MTRKEHPQPLLAFLDGELSDAEASRVDAHVADCETCREELSHHRRLHALLHAAPPTPVKGGLWTELQPRLHATNRAWPHRIAWAGYLLIAVLGVSVGGWAGWSMREDLGEGDSPELLAETSLYDLPENGLAQSYLDAVSGESVEGESR